MTTHTLKTWLAPFAAGAPIYLHVVGAGHPPVWLAVGPVPEVG